MTRVGVAWGTGVGVLTGGDAAEEVSVGLSEESAAKGVGVGMLTPADVAKELCVMLSDEGAAEGVRVTAALLGDT
jgi:hypothetical protein